MILPNLFIPGAAKSGTSSLHNYLNQHPDIFMSKVKEPHFFSHNELYAKGLGEYSKFFEAGKDCNIRGESSTGYMIFPHVIERIKENIPNPKFIFILRNPIDRAYSHYLWLSGHESKTFREAFLTSLDFQPDPNKHHIQGVGFYYFHSGLYGKYIQKFLEAFGKDAVFILTLESLKSQPLSTLNKCCDFLNISHFEEIKSLKLNKTILFRHRLIAKYYLKLFGLSSENPKNFSWESVYGWEPQNISPVKQTILQKILQKAMPLKAAKLVIKKIALRKTYPRITSEERSWIASYYKDDIQHLRQLTGMSFEDWSKDFPCESVIKSV